MSGRDAVTIGHMRAQLRSARELLRQLKRHRPENASLHRTREFLQVARVLADDAERGRAVALDEALRALWVAARSRRPTRNVAEARLQIEAVLAAVVGGELN